MQRCDFNLLGFYSISDVGVQSLTFRRGPMSPGPVGKSWETFGNVSKARHGYSWCRARRSSQGCKMGFPNPGNSLVLRRSFMV